MKKSLIALLVVLALVVTVSAFSVSAEETTAPASADYTLTITDGVATAACPCSEHNGATATFTAWTGVPTTSNGHWYLTDDYSQSSQMALRPGVLHLNGHTLQRTSQGAAIGLHAGTHYILDNPANEGGIMDRNVDGSANSWGGYGGIIQVANANTHLNIYGGTYQMTETARAVNGAVIGISHATCTVHIYGGVYEGDATNASSLGGAFALSAGKLYIHGGTIQNSSAPRGGSIYATSSSAEVHIDGGMITGGSATSRGGNIALLNGAKGYVSGGTITLGTVTGDILSGGNIYVESASKLTVEAGATITDGDASGSGSYGGGNLCYRGTGGGGITINGGTISGGSAVKGGNIFSGGDGTITISGGIISDGFSYGTQIGGNLCIEDTSDLIINGADVMISGGFTTNKTTRADALANKPVNGTSVLGGGRGGNIALRGTATLNMTAGTVSGGNAPTGGNIVFEGTGAAATRVISGGIVTGGYASNGGNIYVNNTGCGATVSGTANVTLGTSAANGGNVYLKGAEGKIATFVLSGGSISEGNGKSTCGGIFVDAYSTFNMTGGELTGNTSKYGGGNLRPNAATATVNISGGTISDGTVTSGDGGNLFCNQAALINITGGTFSGGSVSGVGGNLAFTNAAAGSKIEGVTFIGGVSPSNGGTMYMTATNITEIKDCSFSYTEKTKQAEAGGLFFTSKALTISGCDFTGGYATNGGAIYTTAATIIDDCDFNGVGGNATSGGSIYAAGNVTIQNCNFGDETVADGENEGGSSGSFGGSLFVGRGKTVTMKNCTIYGGQSHRGGAAFVDGSATLNVYGCSIKDTRAGLYGSLTTIGGTINIVNSTVTGGQPAGSAKISGGNIYVQNKTDEDPVLPGSVTIKNDSTLSGSSVPTVISGGEANVGGNVYVASGTFTMEAGTTISGGTSATTGGNIHNAGTVDINGGEITDGHSTGLGGNIYTYNGAVLTVDDCRITNGIAGNKVVDEETGAVSVATGSNGRGGNIASFEAGFTLNNCVIRDGESYSTGGGGGNIYINSTTNTIEATITGCTITGGYGANQSGNIQHHARGTVIINGDSYIAGGHGGAWGSNIGVTNGGAILKIDGDTEINAEGTTGSGNNGRNIHISVAAADLYLMGNSRVVLGDVASYHSIVREIITRSGNATNGYTYTNGEGKVYLGGNAFMDKYVELKVWNADQTAPAGCVEVMEGFTGDALLLTFYSSNNFTTADNSAVGTSTVNFGADAPAYLTAAAGYANTGTVKVHSTGRSGYVVSWTGEKFIIAPYSAFVALNNGADGISSHVEYGLANLTDTLPTGTGYVKLYTGGNITLNAQMNGMPIDLNNQTVTINTNGYTLAPIDYRTDGGTTSRSKLTVTGDESKVELLVVNPVTGYKYLNIKDETAGTWTSNRVRVEMTKVSIKTTQNGIYYTTRIQTNANAAPYLVDYGTAVSLVEMPGEDFLDVAEEKGILYTAFELNTNAAINIETRSALIENILAEGATDPDNNTRAGLNIYANSFVTAIVGGQEIKIMAEENYTHSMKTIMEMLDEKVGDLDIVDDAATIATAVKFYNKWADPFAAWDTLPNLKKAAQAAA